MNKKPLVITIIVCLAILLLSGFLLFYKKKPESPVTDKIQEPETESKSEPEPESVISREKPPYQGMASGEMIEPEWPSFFKET